MLLDALQGCRSERVDMRYGRDRPGTPVPPSWRATGLEWQTSSPPITENFAETPIVSEDPYNYEGRDAEQAI